ncbi:MAG: hypothetical protein LWY06_05830 [Firmicutes bacterium]|nr:hypothetical protein [Bacillota bacterium]
MLAPTKTRLAFTITVAVTVNSKQRCTRIYFLLYQAYSIGTHPLRKASSMAAAMYMKFLNGSLPATNNAFSPDFVYVWKNPPTEKYL